MIKTNSETEVNGVSKVIRKTLRDEALGIYETHGKN